MDALGPIVHKVSGIARSVHMYEYQYGAAVIRDERAFAISMVNRYTHRPYMNSEVLEYLQLRYIKNVSK